jgi:hypothetical protein
VLVAETVLEMVLAAAAAVGEEENASRAEVLLLALVAS